MNPNKALWEKGDFSRIAETMRQSGEALVASLGVVKGMKILDLGCGDGNTAIPAAQMGAEVLGVDISTKLTQAAINRATSAGLTNCTFKEGDACNLSDLADHSFDLVVSIFGAMFAPKPFEVAKELVRVTAPGGRIVMGNWIPGDPTLVAQLLKISTAYTPPPPEGFISPMTWGIEAQVLERFGAAGIAANNIICTREAFTFRAPFSSAAFVARFRDFYGPTMNAFEAAANNGKAKELEDELTVLFKSQNEASAPGTTIITATYLKVMVQC